MSALYSYFLKAGTVSKSTLIGTSGNNVENWAAQSDQTTPLLLWKEPMRASDGSLTTRPIPARIAMNADLSARADGFYHFQWGWPYWTVGQLSYLLTTFFSAPDAYSGVVSAAVTLQTWFETAYVAFTANLYRPVYGQDYKLADGGYSPVILRFDKGVIIT